MEQGIVIVEAVSNGRYYVRETRKLGYTPIIVYPIIPENKGYQSHREHAEEYSRQFDPVFLNEPENFSELLDLLRPFSIQAVVAGSELGVALADKLAEALGLPGNPSKSSACRRNKELMQGVLCHKGLRHIRGQQAQNLEEVLAFAKELDKWPVVLKPLASSATEGVHFCRTEAELAQCGRALFQATDFFGNPNKEILVQEYISGREFIVNCISANGLHQMTDMWMYNKIPIGGEGNAYDYAKLITLIKPGYVDIIAYAFEVLSALDFYYGPSHMEVMVDDSGPVLIEVGARPMGGNFSEDLLDECLGHHLVDLSLVSYLDQEKFLELSRKRYRPKKNMLLKYFISPQEIKVNSTPALPLLRQLPSVRQIECGHILEAHRAVQTVDLSTSPGSIALCHENEDVLMEDYLLIRRIETNYFSMLFQDSEDFIAKADPDHVKRALARMIEHHDHIRDALVVIDEHSEDLQLQEAEVTTLSEVNDLEADWMFERIILHSGNRVYNFADYCDRLKGLAAHLKPGGIFLVTPWAINSTEYGSMGMEIILRLLGMRLEVPMSKFKGVIWATKE